MFVSAPIASIYSNELIKAAAFGPLVARCMVPIHKHFWVDAHRVHGTPGLVAVSG